MQSGQLPPRNHTILVNSSFVDFNFDFLRQILSVLFLGLKDCLHAIYALSPSHTHLPNVNCLVFSLIFSSRPNPPLLTSAVAL